MNSFSRLGFFLVCLTTLLAGCGTVPANNYYLLSAKEAGSLPNRQSPSLGIGPIEIPEYLNRNGLVYNRDGNKLQIANYERWAEPLNSGVQRVISLNLANILNTENVQSYPWPRSDVPEYAVEVKVLLLDARDSQTHLVAEWVVQKPGSKKILGRKITKLARDVPPGVVSGDQIAPAYSDLLYQLSEIIAAAISQDIELAE